MELVYLWVKEYKNIQKQGFNFSPQFNCKFHDEYDEKGKLKDNCKLEIKENDDYIENFFGDNINVTAIVGKNGSGKSSILEYIVRNMYYYFYSDDGNTQSYYYNIFIFYDTTNQQFNILWNSYKHTKIINQTNVTCKIDCITKRFMFIQNSPLQEYSNFDSEYYSDTKDKIKKDIGILHYDYSFSKFYQIDKTSGSIFINTDVNKLYDGHESIVCVPNKNNQCSVINEFKEIEYNDIFNSNNDKFNIIRVLVDNKYIDSQNNYFRPTIVQLFINESINKSDDCADIFEKLINKYIEKKKEKTELINDAKNYLEILEKNKNEINNLFTVENNTFAYGEPIRYNFNIDINNLNSSNIELITKLPQNFINIDLIEGNLTFGKRYEELSSGEKSVLKLIYYIEKFMDTQKKLAYMILLDEPSNDLHPEWQKKLLNYMISIFKNKKEKIHFIFTSHSPLIISDLPKENIVFIKDGENDKGVNHKQTFGANIHTLLSDSFFMEDGLMGEFAKTKIQEIMDFLNDKKSINEISTKEEDIKKVIETIGEPFLKDKLLKMYEEKYPRTDEDKIQELEAEIERIRRGKNQLQA